jgi:hypothetical protein
MTDRLLYHERISSSRTTALFVVLALFFIALLNRHRRAGKFGLAAAAYSSLFCLFLFYSLNFRTLSIRLTPEFLLLTFGIFSWKVPVENIDDWRLDKIPPLMRYGGAGIHFMRIRQRYRASFNFLEYPRVVVALKRNTGLVQDISFSTRRPDEVMLSLEVAVIAAQAV